MTGESTHDAQKRLENLLSTMDVPEMRRHDIGWLSRNLAINNQGHPLLPDALAVLKQLRRMLRSA